MAIKWRLSGQRISSLNSPESLCIKCGIDYDLTQLFVHVCVSVCASLCARLCVCAIETSRPHIEPEDDDEHSQNPIMLLICGSESKQTRRLKENENNMKITTQQWPPTGWEKV